MKNNSAGTESAENKSGKTAAAGEGRSAAATATAQGRTAGANGSATAEGRKGGSGNDLGLLGVTSQAEMEDRLKSMLNGTEAPNGKARQESRPTSNSPTKGRREPVMEHGVEEQPDEEEGGESTESGEAVTREEHEPASEAVSTEELEAGEDEAAEGEEPEGETEEEDPEGEADEEAEGEDPEAADAAKAKDGEKEPPKDWPKSAVREVTELRKARRELRDSVEATKQELQAAMERLESEELKRPVAPTPANPLAFAETPEALEKWTQSTQQRLDQIEEFLDEGLSGRGLRELQSWAEANGATNAEGEIDKGALKALKRDAREALTKHVPARREYFQQEKVLSAAVEKDPVLGAVWKDKTSQEYKDAMAVMQTLPELRRLPHWKGTAALIAVGLRELRKSQASTAGAGKEGEKVRARGEQTRTTQETSHFAAGPTLNGGTAATGVTTKPAGKSAAPVKAKGPVPTVKGAGRTVLPRNVASEDVDAQSISQRLASGAGTTADAEAMARRALTGKVR